MRINSDQIGHIGGANIAPFYWISGDETLLVQETLTQLRARVREQGFSEWELLFVDRAFDWQSLLQSGNSMSLFSDKKIIELRLQSAKLDDVGKATLKQYLHSPNPDNVLILVSPRVEPAALNTQWFKALESAGVFVTVWPVYADKLPGWIRTRLANAGMTADPDAIAILAERVEGNLLAADQEIEKLSVLTGTSRDQKVHIDRKRIMSLVADSSRYSSFNLIDSALLGDARRCIKIVAGLRAEGTEILQLLGALSAQLRRLVTVSHHMARGQSLAQAMKSEGVRGKQEKGLSQAVQRVSLREFEAMLGDARRIDLAVKGLSPADPWNELTQLVLRLSGHRILPQSVLS